VLRSVLDNTYQVFINSLTASIRLDYYGFAIILPVYDTTICELCSAVASLRTYVYIGLKSLGDT
jgi:hypothetical protein